MLRSVVCLVKSIKEDKRTHPMVVTSLIVNTHSFIRLITKLQELKIIPKNYEIVRGLRSDGINSAIEFNNHKKAIFVGTPWMVTGTDAPNTDGLIADYDMGSEITGSQWIGRGQRPVDGKELIVYIPTNPDSTEISTLLRVANKYINDENIHVEAEESNITEEDTVLGSVQRRNITSEIDRDINTNPVLKAYWDKVYEDLTTNVIGRTGDYSVFLPFEEAREFVWSLNLKNQDEWQEYCSSGKRPFDIPTKPRIIYNNEFLSLPDWLGTMKGWTGYMEYNELIDYVRSLGIKSQSGWIKYWKENEKPNNIPMYPNNTYTEWSNWYYFLGTEAPVNFITYKEAEQYVQKLKIMKMKHYYVWCKTEDRPKNIPTNPQTMYKNNGWESWGKFLGTGIIADRNKNFLTYKEAKKIIISLGLKNASEWRDYSSSGKRPNNIPANPRDYYTKTNEWINWGDWLGTNKKSNKEKYSDEFLSEIINLLRNGKTQTFLRKKYGIGRSKLNELNKFIKSF
jgi:hypothetical protein